VYTAVTLPKTFGLLRWLYCKHSNNDKNTNVLNFKKKFVFFSFSNVRPNSVLRPFREYSRVLRLTNALLCASSRFLRLLFLPFTPEWRQQQIHLSLPPTNHGQAVGRQLPRQISCMTAVYKVNLSDPINNLFSCILILTLLRYYFTTQWQKQKTSK
jgi:hypothetical protein